jgi:hypothetical protein
MTVTPEVGLSLDNDTPWGVFLDAMFARELSFTERTIWSTATSSFETEGDVLLRMVFPYAEATVVAEDEALLYVSIGNGVASVSVAARSTAAVSERFSDLRERLPLTVYGDGLVPLTFWTYTPHGARSISRQIEAPAWSAITENYAGTVREKLDRIMGSFRPSHGGQLVLWQGDPGTGKTYALRALAWEWREWADFHYIVDPERFFGEHSEYMLDVLLSGDDGLTTDSPAPARWKVLILEDTGELLSTDAKERAGQALSRLLNVVDGIIGQGLRVLVIVTTNEEIRDLHPAISRPGRCAAKIGFEPLSRVEALDWLIAHGTTPDGTNAPGLLADLYAMREGYEVVRDETTVGFAAA